MAKRNFIQSAIKHPGALRRSARKGEITKKGTLNLRKMLARAKKTGNTLLARRVRLAQTLAKLRRRKRA